MAVAVCSATVTAASQTAAAAQNTAAAPAQTRVTGCVERADQVTSNGSTIGTTVDSLDFVLIKAMPTAQDNGTAGNATTSARPAGTSESSTDVGKMYRLSADTVQVNPHVGHRVEISGSIQTAGPGTTAETSSASEVDRNNPSAATAPLLKVQTLRMISETCAR